MQKNLHYRQRMLTPCFFCFLDVVVFLKISKQRTNHVKKSRIHFWRQCSMPQGDPNQILLIQMAKTLKICISDPMLVKLRCVFEVSFFLKIVNKQLKIVNKQLKYKNKCTPPKHIGSKNAYFQSYSQKKS